MSDIMRDKFDSPQYARNKSENSGERKKNPPPAETFAEIYYYKKQIDSKTLMVFVLQDGEEIRDIPVQVTFSANGYSMIDVDPDSGLVAGSQVLISTGTL